MPFFSLLYRISFTLYAFVGIFYFKWGIFPIIFLFWTENMIQTLFLLLISLSTKHILISEGEEPAFKLIYAKFFINAIYFVFLTFGWGFLSLMTGKGNRESFEVVTSIATVLMGRDSGFNFAVLLCVVREAWIYFRDFVFNKVYTSEKPFEFPSTFGYKEVVLHLSLILGMGGSVALSQWLTQDDSPTFLSNYGFIIFFLILKLVVEIFLFLESKKQANRESIP